MEGIDPMKSWQPANVRCRIQPQDLRKDKSETLFEKYYKKYSKNSFDLSEEFFFFRQLLDILDKYLVD